MLATLKEFIFEIRPFVSQSDFLGVRRVILSPFYKLGSGGTRGITWIYLFHTKLGPVTPHLNALSTIKKSCLFLHLLEI